MVPRMSIPRSCSPVSQEFIGQRRSPWKDADGLFHWVFGGRYDVDRAVAIKKLDGIPRFQAEFFADVDRDNALSFFQNLSFFHVEPPFGSLKIV